MTIQQLTRDVADIAARCGANGPETGAERLSLGKARLRLGEALLGAGDPAAARDELVRARDALGRTITGTGHLGTIIQVEYMIGQADEARGSLDAAHEQFKRALGLLEAWGDQHAGARQVAERLAGVYKKQGDRQAELDARLKALASAELTLDRDDRALQRLHDAIADAHAALGDDHAALVHLKRALEISSKREGEDHEDTAVSRNHLARGHMRLDDLTAALPHALHALATLTSIGGLGTAKAHDQVGDIHLRLKEWSLAHERHARALSLASGVLDDDDPFLSAAHTSLADSCLWLGRSDEALRHAERALDKRLERYGEHAPVVATSHANLAIVLEKRGDHDAALRHAREALEIRRQDHRKRFQSVVDSHMQIAWLLQAVGDFGGVLVHAPTALELLVEHLGPDDARTADAHYLVALAHANLGKEAKALPHASTAYQMRVATLGHAHRKTIIADDLVGTVRARLGDHAAALAHLARALHGRLGLTGEDRQVERPERNLALAMRRLPRTKYHEALAPLVQRAHALLADDRFGREHIETIDALELAATTMTRLGMYAEAQPYREQAVDSLSRTCGSHDLRTIKAKQFLIAANARLGQLDLAIELLREVVDLRKEVPGLDYLAPVLEPLGLVCAYREGGSRGAAREAFSVVLGVIEESTGADFIDSVDVGAAAIGVVADGISSLSSS